MPAKSHTARRYAACDLGEAGVSAAGRARVGSSDVT
jgi:hypothetical protein